MFKEILGFRVGLSLGCLKVGVFGIGFRVWISGHTFLGLS